MVKTISTRWGKAVKGKITIDVVAILGEEDQRSEISDAEALSRLKDELARTNNNEILDKSLINLVNHSV
jgi:hypothetical protein